MLGSVDLKLLGLAVVFCSVFTETTASAKRGLCIGPGTHMCGDFAVWSEVNWWYSWTRNFWLLNQNADCGSYSPNFVSMIWGWRQGADYPVFVPQSTTAILGYNEPNHVAQSNLTPEEGASHWPEIQHRADVKNLPLVSPAAAYCGSNCISNTTYWFDEFFRLCTNCRVDFLATHAYWCSADDVMDYLLMLWNRYGLKIWLTEFACGGNYNATQQLEFMQALIPRLEAADYVARYSWYSSRLTSDAYVKTSASLLMADQSALTPLGEYYNSVP